jgi:hypothetical protein
MTNRNPAQTSLDKADSKTTELVNAIQSILTRDVIDFDALRGSLIGEGLRGRT